MRWNSYCPRKPGLTATAGAFRGEYSANRVPSLVIKNVVNPHRALRHGIYCIFVIYIR
jgi:hypothetical protein